VGNIWRSRERRFPMIGRPHGPETNELYSISISNTCYSDLLNWAWILYLGEPYCSSSVAVTGSSRIMCRKQAQALLSLMKSWYCYNFIIWWLYSVFCTGIRVTKFQLGKILYFLHWCNPNKQNRSQGFPFPIIGVLSGLQLGANYLSRKFPGDIRLSGCVAWGTFASSMFTNIIVDSRCVISHCQFLNLTRSTAPDSDT
jgi:hypothetical protein